MALDRTNMVSLLDIGLLNNGSDSKIVELGNGFTEISEDWAPNSESTQYVNMKNASNTVKGYEFSMDAEREYLSDEVQTSIDELFRTFPTGSACETFYYRFLKSDVTTSGTYKAIKLPVTVAPSSIGGAGGDTLTSTVSIAGNGDAVEGTITVSADGYTFTAN